MGKKVPFWQFFRKGCLWGPQKCIIAFEKFFLFWVPMNIYKDWKAKLESAYSFRLKYSKITVCIIKSTDLWSPHVPSALLKRSRLAILWDIFSQLDTLTFNSAKTINIKGWQCYSAKNLAYFSHTTYVHWFFIIVEMKHFSRLWRNHR